MIAIHKYNDLLTKEWISYCEENTIPYIIVNCYDNNIINILKDNKVKGLMWHHSHMKYQDLLIAKSILFSVKAMGIQTFPDFNSNWHFDDKISQKYLLETIESPLIPSYVFFDKKTALKWIGNTDFPKVFKLRGGSGARNVKLVKNKKKAIKIVNKAFSSGFKPFDKFQYLKERIRKFKEKKGTFTGIFKGVYRIFNPPFYTKMLSNEKGYVYFQDFVPNNNFDIRLIVINGKYIYGMKRMVRKGDFRASGSKNFVYDAIDNEILKIGINIAQKLKLQSVAFDFVLGEGDNPLIVEISYGFGTEGSGKCKGYWDEDLKWHEGKFNPYGWMVEGVLNDIKKHENGK